MKEEKEVKVPRVLTEKEKSILTEGIRTKKRGDYIKVIAKGEVMATYSKKTGKTWGATKYFKYLYV